MKSKKKKKSSPHFGTFPSFHFQFPPSLLQFSFFSSPFSPFFIFPYLFFPSRWTEISWSEVCGGHSAPLPLRHCCTDDTICVSETQGHVVLPFWENCNCRFGHPVILYTIDTMQAAAFLGLWWKWGLGCHHIPDTLSGFTNALTLNSMSWHACTYRMGSCTKLLKPHSLFFKV